MKTLSIFSVALVLAACSVARADIMLTNATIYTQDFNGMASTSTSTIMPADWSFVETGTGANTSYTASTGSLTTNDTYSYGSTSAVDRALGEITGDAFTSVFGAEFQNAGPLPMTKIKFITYTGEQWRNGGTTVVDRLDFQYSVDATSLTTGTWNDLNSLDFTSPITAGLGTLDGNLAANQTAKAQPKVAFVSQINPGATFWIRWTPTNVTGLDDGLSIDNFSIQAIPEPSSMALCGVIAGIMGISLVRRRQQRRAA